MRKKGYMLYNRLKTHAEDIYMLYGKHEIIIKKCAGSPLLPFVLFGLLVVSCFISTYLSLILFFVFWVSLAFNGIAYFRKKRVKRIDKAIAKKEAPSVD